MAFLTREQLLEKSKFKIEKVDLGEDDFVYVRQMSGHERDKFERTLLTEVKKEDGEVVFERAMEDFRAKLAACTICDEQGELILYPEDAALFSRSVTAARLEAIITKAQELNKITQKDKENLVKNSAAVRSGDSTSGSAENLDSATLTNSSDDSQQNN
jgi:hypothetical protein